MTPDERKDYNHARKIQKMCDEAKEWDGPVSFENIWQTCCDELHKLRYEIGVRVTAEQDEK